MSEFSGKVVVITGVGLGIGRRTALLFGKKKAKVVLVDRDESAARETLAGRYGRIGILFANAATQIAKPVVETTEREWNQLHSVNLKGVFVYCKHAIPVMQKEGGGCIVIASSGHAFFTYPNCSAYASTKGVLPAFKRGTAFDYAADGIRVNSVIPGTTNTALFWKYLPECADPAAQGDRIRQTIPLRWFAQSADIVKAVKFLASDAVAYIIAT